MNNITKRNFKRVNYVIIEKDIEKNNGYLAYIDITGYRGSVDELEENIHGGITYRGDTIPITKDRGNWIGWDYSHYGDTEVDGLSKYSEKEVEKQIRSVINDMLILNYGAILKEEKKILENKIGKEFKKIGIDFKSLNK